MNRNQLVAAQSTLWFPLAPLQLEDQYDRMTAIGVYPVLLLSISPVTGEYNNADWWRIARTGGCTQLIIGSGGYGQANGGVTLPCRGCWIQARAGNTDSWVTSANEADPGIGPFIPGPDEGCQPIFIPISDVAKIWVGGRSGDIIDIVYLLG